jgi:type IV pilus assembly protein PilE
MTTSTRRTTTQENHVKRQRGVTLIELVIVVVIIGILASIAVPAYQNYIRRANRTDGRAALLALATAQEKYYLQCNSYAADITTSANDCGTGNLQFDPNSERGYYTIAVTAADTEGWTATATPNGLPQSKDTKCQSFTLTSTGLKTASGGGDTSEECWGK